MLAKVVGIAFGLLVGAIGAACLFRPAVVQDYVVKSQVDTWLWRVNPFQEWMQRPGYRVFLRCMGVLDLLFGALIILSARHIR